MTTADALELGRASFARQAWGDAYAQLSAEDRKSPLAPDDLERLGTAAYLLGKDEECFGLGERGYHEWLRRGDEVGAARCAFWLGFGLMNRGETARAGGWLARARRLLDEGEHDCVEQGYLLVPVALQGLFEGDGASAYAAFEQVGKVGARFGDRDLVVLSQLGRGQALTMLGKPGEAMPLFDEAMVAVTAGEVSVMVVGIVYCAVIEACQEAFDLRRAQEWTAALSRWCLSQPDLVPYRGQCLVHRAEIMQLHGAWPDAMDEVRRARERLSQPPGQPAVGAAIYQQGELHRLCGEFAQAEEAYRQGSQWGRESQPGLALLRLAQGQVDAATAGIRRAMDESPQGSARAKLLAAYVEIALVAGDVAAARGAADELAQLAADFDAPLLEAVATHAQGAVLLAEGDDRGALAALRRAWRAWQGLDAPYEAARARVLIGLACRKVGDEDAARMELDAASWVFQHLGAATDVARVEMLSRTPDVRSAGGLTSREVQVLRLVASGKTNRAIAADLCLSEKTVARHVSNIFTKLALSSRAAATAYAYEHELV